MFKPLILAALSAATSASSGLANKPIGALDLTRYAGTWHEIAHLPMYFQRHCVDTITATYTPRSDDTIEVRNACRTQSGEMDESVGAARPVAGSPGALKVRFAPEWLSWLPVVWADYWVVDLDSDYQWAVVGGPSRKYLWVLSRQPDMDRAVFESIKARAAKRGYPVDRLKMAAPLR
ncbi:lipocalin family protein [Lysobacter koreensis]|uniref:Outer membrane lipoprotein Blc n=1 Tax=Lysobacter koreensis TaxID=266122 RepID=A0ABW2YIG9_9GAMM